MNRLIDRNNSDDEHNCNVLLNRQSCKLNQRGLEINFIIRMNKDDHSMYQTRRMIDNRFTKNINKANDLIELWMAEMEYE